MSDFRRSRPHAALVVVALLGCCFADRFAVADSSLIGRRVLDVDGNIQRIGMNEGLNPVAIVLLDTGCPIARR